MTVPKRIATYSIAGPHVAAEDFDGEYVVLDLATGRYFSFSDGAALAWTGLVVAGLTPEELAADLAPGSSSRRAFDSFVENMIGAGLICEAERTSESEAEGLAELIAAPGTNFAFEAFDDLSDLLAADPIHDVEKATGWPHSEPSNP